MALLEIDDLSKSFLLHRVDRRIQEMCIRDRSRPVDTGEMHVTRRVSAAFKDVPGGQLLGATRDYSHRLLAFDLETEGIGELAEKRAELARHFADAADAPAPATTLPRVLDYLRAQGLVAHVPADDAQPVDATMVPLTFPAPRSVRPVSYTHLEHFE